jgi:release factor glutamine methyltransferase
VPSPDTEARWLVEEASGYEGPALAQVLDQVAPRLGVARFDAMLARREQGEPVQYVLGRWAFRRLDLFVDRRVLIPRPETELVAGAALDELDRVRAGRPVPAVVADLGTGSGAIGLSVAVERPGVEVWLTDCSEDALAVARANLAGVGPAATAVRLAAGSWFEALPAELAGTLAVVVSNPPYVAEGEALADSVAGWEPAEALFSGPSGLEHLSALVAGAGRWLVPGGALVLEMAPHQAEPVARAAAGRFAEVEVRPDLAGKDRVLVARRPHR